MWGLSEWDYYWRVKTEKNGGWEVGREREWVREREREREREIEGGRAGGGRERERERETGGSERERDWWVGRWSVDGVGWEGGLGG
jgi:hypothetical protein